VDVEERDNKGKAGLNIYIEEAPDKGQKTIEPSHVNTERGGVMDTAEFDAFREEIEKDQEAARRLQGLGYETRSGLYHLGIPEDIIREALAPETFEEGIGRYAVYKGGMDCAEPTLPKVIDVNVLRDGDCLFDSLRKLDKLKVSCKELRTALLDHASLQDCGDPTSAAQILASDKEYGDLDCIYVFTRKFEINVCIHFEGDNRKSIPL
jgi:hypothetical protein